MDYGKWGLRILVMSVVAAILLSLIGWIYNAVVGISVAWGAILGTVLAIILFGAAIKYNPGKESFVEYLPVLLIVSAVLGTLAILIPTIPLSFVIDWSLVGLALAFSAVFFAGGITAKIL